MELLEFRIAEHEVVVGIPEHEGLGDRLDGVVQAGVGAGGLLVQAALLGHVHRDADEMARRVVGSFISSARARSHTQSPLMLRMRNS